MKAKSNLPLHLRKSFINRCYLSMTHTVETNDFKAKIDLDGFKAVYCQRDLFDKFEISNQLNETEKNEESKFTRTFRELLNLTKIKQIYEAITDSNGNIIIEALKNYFINKLNFTVTDDQMEMISKNGKN